VLGVVIIAACGPTDVASRRDLPEAPLAADVTRAAWRDPNRAPADEIMVVLWWDKDTRRLTRVITAAPVYAAPYYDDDEVRRICVDKVRMAGGKRTISVYARRGVQLAQAVHEANMLAAAKTGAVELLVEE